MPSSMRLGGYCLLVFLSLASWAAPPVSAQDESSEGDRGAGLAIRLPGRIGLTGFQDMVDARSPKGPFSIRGGVRYDVTMIEQDFDGAVRNTREKEIHDLSIYVGGSLFGLVDVSARIPWSYRVEENNLSGLRDTVDRDHGWADFDFAAKVTLQLGPVTLAPYVKGRFDTGEPEVNDLMEFEWGAAGTFSILNDYVSFHGNAAGFTREQGLFAVKFRLGVSFVVWTGPALTLRVYGYGDGVEYEGRAKTDGDFEFGAQAILFEFLTVEVGASVRLLDAGYLDETTKDSLRAQNVYDRHFDDEGTWQIQLAIGVVF
ncbi:MAG: hypothetical protein JKY65_18435 [Planctomycetes bacterium]|nr:hypothetical protein [Planctomycetota bacterium]